MAGCVCVHRERKCIGCAVLISLPNNMLLRHQDFHRIIVWEASNNCAPKADTMLLKKLFFVYSTSCRIKPQNFVIDQIWRSKFIQQQDAQTLLSYGFVPCVSQPRHLYPRLPPHSQALGAATLLAAAPCPFCQLGTRRASVGSGCLGAARG